MNQIEIEKFAELMKKKSDQLINYFLIAFFMTGILLSFPYNTLGIAIGVGGTSLIAYYSAKIIFSHSNFYQYVLGVVMGVFMGQFIYQMHGMFEMHFVAFIASAILITFRNWKLQIPLAVFVTLHHLLFNYLQYKGHHEVYFTEHEYVPLPTFIIHSIFTTAIFSICGLWSYNIKRASEVQITQSLEIGKLLEASKQKEALVAMSENLKTSNNRLNEVNRELKTIFNTIDDVLFSIDIVQGRIIQLSAAFEKMSGYDRADFMADLNLWQKFIYPDDIFRMMNINGAEAGKIIVNQFRINHKNSSIRWIEAKIIPSYDEKGTLVRIEGIAKDITEAKQATQALQDSYEKLIVNKQLMKATEKLAQIGSWQYDVINNEVNWSDQTFRIYGYEPGECEASYGFFLNHVHPDDLEYADAILQYAFKHLSTQKLSFRIVTRKGNIKYLQAELIISRDSEGRPIKVTGFKQDITEKVMLENKLAEERLHKQQEITEAVILAQEKERSFLGEELHDNINPTLATVKLYMDCALENEDMRISLIKDTKNCVNGVMNDIRRMTKSMLPPSLGVVSLLDALKDMIDNIARVNEITFNTDFSEINEKLISDKLKLTIFRISQEQITNILKHAKAKEVNVSLIQQGNILSLLIKDDGVGFDTTKKRDGVGLQNIFSRAQLHNGEVSINSTIDGGCELLIKFTNDQTVKMRNNLSEAS